MTTDARETEGPAARRWRELVERRARQMDDAYAALGRTSADYWSRRVGSGTSVLRRTASEDDPLLKVVLPHVTPHSTLIDVGAGAGRYAVALAPHLGRVVAVEPEAAMIPLLKAAINERGATNVEVLPAKWEDADIAPAESVICAHVLYPIANAVPFLRKLDDHATAFCALVLRETSPDPEPLGALWERFHREPRYLQPGYMEALNLLYELGIRANVSIARVPGPSWSYPTIEDSVAAAREHLILRDEPLINEALRAELRKWLVRDGELLRLPVQPAHAGVLWWEKEAAVLDGPRVTI